ncbi:MAG: ABC transporter permease subunit [Rhizobacter sp.]|nr:ABC transporter permease subunit [Bacteriovorax sp.]
MKKTIASMLFFLTCWQLLCHFIIIDPVFFPAPLSIIKNTFFLLIQDNLLVQVFYSMKRLGLASLVAIPAAIFLAIAVTHVKNLDNYINPVIAFTFPLPKVAIYPLLLLIFGIDDTSKIVLIGIGIFYLIFINLRIGIKRLLNSQSYDLVRIYKLTRFDYIWNFILKGTQQELITGLKLGLNYGLTLVVVSEFSTSNNGIGYFIWRSWDQFKIINVYSGILILSILGFVFYFIFNTLIERASDRFY